MNPVLIFSNRRRYCLFLTVAFCFRLQAQDTFSKRHDLSLHTVVFNSLELVNDTIFVSGIARDTVNGYHLTNVLSKFTTSGELIESTIFRDEGETVEVWGKDYRYQNMIIQTGYSLTPSFMKGLVQAFNLEGELLWRKKAISFIDPFSYFRYDAVCVLNDKIYVAGTSAVEAPYQIENVLITYSLEGDLLNQFRYNTPNWIDQSLSIIPFQDEYLIIGSRLTDVFRNNNNFHYCSKLVCIDTLGNLIWHWASPTNELQQGADSMIPTLDSGLVIATAIGTEIPVNSEHSEVYWNCYIYKLDANLEKSWGTYFRHNDYATEFHRFRKLIEIADGSGYVAVGTASYWSGGYNIEEENVYDWGGIIAKVSPEGDSLWSRIIIHPDLPTFEERHNLYDVSETSDGHFVLAGESRHEDTSPSQQGWLLKVDEWGCLVPGCHLISDTKEVVVPEMQLLIYPNPASDLLNVYLGPGKLEQLTQLCLIDIQGRIVQQRAVSETDATYIMDISELIKGQYFVQLYQSGQAIGKSKAVLIQ